MSTNHQATRAALQTLDSLTNAVDRIRDAADVSALGSVVHEATVALETLRRHHASVGMPVDEHAVIGNGHGRR